ncbi:MAG: glycosyl hydrolase-related protein [Nocardiaceae bacterium]|nr:glycosyl hydrolase-related protein [Nocardiaceae bacterium]
MSAHPLPGEPEPFARVVDGPFHPVDIGTPWGPAWTTTWFRVQGAVPAGWAEDGPVAAVLDIGFDADAGPGFQCEGLVFTGDGTILKGIHPRNKEVPIRGGEVDLYVEAAANPDIAAEAFRPTRLGDGIDVDGTPLYRLKRADLVLIDPAVEQLAVDVDVLLGWAQKLPADRPRRARVLSALNRACDALDLHDVRGTAARARELLAPELARPAEASAHHVAAIGHAHIDSAWLWPTRETIRKSTRTFSNVLALAEQYPELRFACSQAQQYEWVERAQPQLFERIREAVAHGTWIPAGGMWVESDTNLPGGEALVRQFLYGKSYFRDRFGVEPKEVWLPDSFGYTAALPQIAALAGFQWFITQKLAWKPTNHFPHHTFWWEGIDGTRLFSHMPPVDTYLSELSAAELDHAVSNFAEHAGANTSMVPFGHGDGGGGPTALMMERARRQSDLEGSPRITHSTPEGFFAAAEAEYPDAPTWVGELYLEGHRGTYTSQAAMKRGNRRSEHLLREAELWSATAAVRLGHPYPYERFDAIWKDVLLHQFHDILPGSSIAWVHRQAAERYAELELELEAIVADAIAALAGEGEDTIAFNAAPNRIEGVPALGAGPIVERADLAPVNVQHADGATTFDNGVLHLVFDGSGAISSAVDLTRRRELVGLGGRLNELVLHQDLPNAFDAWDVDVHYLGSSTVVDGVEALEIERHENGAVSLVVERSFSRSHVRQRTTLHPGAREVDFAIEVDWHEAERLLKVAFPLDVRAESSTSEIQFGHVSRPTHQNTTWDAAKFEICAHRWVHVGEPGFGVALANDATYGHDIRRRGDPAGGRPGTEVRLSLLRAPRYPDPETDQGVHRFAYKLVSDAGVADAVDAGYRMNLPLRMVTGRDAALPLVTVEGQADAARGVLVESVKLAEDRSGDVIVRLYESLGARTQVTVSWDIPGGTASIVDLLERDLDALSDVDGQAALEFRPFQIVSLRIRRGAQVEERDA